MGGCTVFSEVSGTEGGGLNYVIWCPLPYALDSTVGSREIPPKNIYCPLRMQLVMNSHTECGISHR